MVFAAMQQADSVDQWIGAGVGGGASGFAPYLGRSACVGPFPKSDIQQHPATLASMGFRRHNAGLADSMWNTYRKAIAECDFRKCDNALAFRIELKDRISDFVGISHHTENTAV